MGRTSQKNRVEGLIEKQPRTVYDVSALLGYHNRSTYRLLEGLVEENRAAIVGTTEDPITGKKRLLYGKAR